MIFNFLEIPQVAPVVEENIDTVKQALLDTAGKTDLEKEVITSINTLTNSSAEDIWSMIVDKGIQLGFKLLAALAIFLIGAWLIKLLKKAVSRSFQRHKADKAVESFALSMLTALLWVILIILSVGALGVETTSLAALLAAGGMAIGMALSGTVQNFAGGLMLLIFKPFKAGDYIEAQGYAGTVSEINITATKIITNDNKVVILPNGALQNGTINNYSKLNFRRVDLSIKVEYGSDSELVKKTLLDIAAAEKRVLSKAEGAPDDAFTGISDLGSSGVEYTLRMWVKTEDYWGVYFSVNEAVYNTLPQKGIDFPYTQISVHMN